MCGKRVKNRMLGLFHQFYNAMEYCKNFSMAGGGPMMFKRFVPQEPIMQERVVPEEKISFNDAMDQVQAIEQDFKRLSPIIQAAALSLAREAGFAEKNGKEIILFKEALHQGKGASETEWILHSKYQTPESLSGAIDFEYHQKLYAWFYHKAIPELGKCEKDFIESLSKRGPR